MFNIASNALGAYVNKSAPSYPKVKKYGKVGGGLAGIGGAIMVAFPVILNLAMDWQLQFEEGNLLTGIWKDVPIALTTNIYVWNLDNPEEFAAGAKPRMSERGPFAFKTYLSHEILGFNDDGQTFRFNIIIKWFFDPEKSKGNYDGQVTMLNMPAYAGAGLAANILDRIPLSFALAPIVYGFMNVYFLAHGEGLIKETTPRDLIEGTPLGMLITVDSLIVKPMKWVGLDLPPFELLDKFLANNVFGLLHLANGTKLGPYEAYTGKDDPKKLGKVIAFNNENILTFFNERRCNLINGSEGLFHGTYMNKNQVVNVFFACRALAFTYSGMSLVKGSPQWRFRMAPEFMAGPKKNRYNKCFCQMPDDPDMCDGIFDAGPCAFLAPAALSYPHFLYAGPKVRSLVDGMNPDPGKHEAYFDINPTLGLPVDARVRVQANLITRSHPLLFGFGSVPRSVYPLIWVELGIFPEGLLNWLMIIGLNAFTAIDYAPTLLFYSGLGVLGYTSLLSFKDRKALFKKPSPRGSPPLSRLDPVDQQMETKARDAYPNLFAVSDGVQPSPPRYSPTRPQYTEQMVQTVPNGSVEPKRVVSPPGDVD